jgi:hypothetical protein
MLFLFFGLGFTKKIYIKIMKRLRCVVLVSAVWFYIYGQCTYGHFLVVCRYGYMCLYQYMREGGCLYIFHKSGIQLVWWGEL